MTMKRWYSEGRTCLTCGVPVSNYSKTGACRKCSMARMNSDPAIRQKAVEKIRETLATPRMRAVLSMNAKIASRRRMADPKIREQAARIMREKVQPLTCTPEALAKRDLKAMGRAISKAKLAWCPEGYRDLYINLMRNHGVRKGDAQKMVLEQAKADLAALSPFERQERALQKGAQLAANDRGPMFGEVLKVAG